MKDPLPEQSFTPRKPAEEAISCPHCHFEFKISDLADTQKDDFFRCPICGNKIPSPAMAYAPQRANYLRQIISPSFIIGIALICVAVYFLMPAPQKTQPPVVPVLPVQPPPAVPVPELQTSAPPAAKNVPAALPDPEQKTLPSAQPALPPKDPPDKMKIIKALAARYHASHTYTMAGGFVCLDMAIDLWNQLRTFGIDAKIMGGILTQNITAWNFQKLATEGNHAWVVAMPSPDEKVAIETTEGKVITLDMENSAAYFKGIAFDTPAQIKAFEFYRRKTFESCREAGQMIEDWNANIAGKPQKYEDLLARKSQITSRKQECENSFKKLKEFEDKAIYY